MYGVGKTRTEAGRPLKGFAVFCLLFGRTAGYFKDEEERAGICFWKCSFEILSKHSK